MRVRIDRNADAVYLNLTDRRIKESEEIADGIVVDYDDHGRIVGIEVLDASSARTIPTCSSSIVSSCQRPADVRRTLDLGKVNAALKRAAKQP
jgi:uncharacterized protein YuzE